MTHPKIPTAPRHPTHGRRIVGPALWTPADGGFQYYLTSSDPATVTRAASAVTAVANKGSAGGSVTQVSGALQPSINLADLNGFDTMSFNNDSLSFGAGPVLPSGWAVAIVFNADVAPVRDKMSLLGVDFNNTYIPVADTSTAPLDVNLFIVDLVQAPSATVQRLNGAAAPWANRAAGYNALVTGKWATAVFSGLPASDEVLAWGRAVGQYYLVGKSVDLIIKTSNFTADEYQRIEGYAAHKYKGTLLADLDAGHPYKLSPPTV